MGVPGAVGAICTPLDPTGFSHDGLLLIGSAVTFSLALRYLLRQTYHVLLLGCHDLPPPPPPSYPIPNWQEHDDFRFAGASTSRTETVVDEDVKMLRIQRPFIANEVDAKIIARNQNQAECNFDWH